MPQQISLRLPDALARRLDRLAKERRMDRSMVVREAIQAYLVSAPAEEGDRPLDRVRDLAGSLRGGPPDLGARHREYLKRQFAGE